jgi:UDP-N-acetylglucosamine:LPS N-acetylglucosamine transferase
MKICLTCSAGGHLTQALVIKKLIEELGYDHFFVVIKEKNIEMTLKNEKYYLVESPERSVFKTFKSILQTFDILKKEKPRVIISTGAGVSVVVCYVGKFIFKSRVIHIESFSRVYAPSLTGKLLYPISNLFFVQWPYLKKKYGKKAIYAGSLL